VRIDGGTSVDERQTIVDNFNCRGVGQVRAAAAAAAAEFEVTCVISTALDCPMMKKLKLS
jgi:hypothetical protein